MTKTETMNSNNLDPTACAEFVSDFLDFAPNKSSLLAFTAMSAAKNGQQIQFVQFVEQGLSESYEVYYKMLGTKLYLQYRGLVEQPENVLE